MNFLVTGLESSCTRYVSKILAENLGITPRDGWNGHNKAEGNGHSVVHRSLPHKDRDNFITKDLWMDFEVVIICTRDLNCSLESKVMHHQRDRRLAVEEQEKGRVVMSEILRTHPKAEIFSYESAFSIGEEYNKMFFKRIGVNYLRHNETKEINAKYFPKAK